MKLVPESHKDFGYLKVYDLYSKDELEKIWKEVFHLDYVMELEYWKKERAKGAAKDQNGNLQMSGDGLFLDSVYANREYSSILTYNRRVFNKDVMDSISKTHPANKVAYSCINKDRTIINRYCASQNYSSHFDLASYTAITILLHKPKYIKGGELKFTDYDITFKPKNNICIIFPSWVKHAVSPIECSGGSKRYSIAQLMYIVNP